MLAVACTGAAADDLKIAVVGSLTGAYATAGDQVRRGAELAAAHINAAGGVNGSRVVLVLEDDACDPKQAVSVAHRVVAAGIKLVDGHVCSGASIPASEVYSEAGVLMMTPASVNSKLPDMAFERQWPTIMRLYVRDDVQGRLLGPWMAERFAGRRVAFLHDRTAFGKNLADQVLAAARQAGLKEVLYDSVNIGEKDYGAVITKLRETRIDVLYYGGYPTEAALILRQAAEQGFKFQMVATSAFATPEFWAVAGTAGEGTIFPFPSDPRSWSGASQVVTELRRRGFEPEGFTLFSYAVVQALAEGFRRVGKFDGALIAAALRSAPVGTIFGSVSFDEKGDAQGVTYDINVWRNGTYAKID